MIATAPAREPSLIGEMMERLAIEPAGGVVPRQALRYLIAFNRCEACACKRACRDWLAGMPASVTLPPKFCPNADIFTELQLDQPGFGSISH